MVFEISHISLPVGIAVSARRMLWCSFEPMLRLHESPVISEAAGVSLRYLLFIFGRTLCLYMCPWWCTCWNTWSLRCPAETSSSTLADWSLTLPAVTCCWPLVPSGRTEENSPDSHFFPLKVTLKEQVYLFIFFPSIATSGPSARLTSSQLASTVKFRVFVVPGKSGLGSVRGCWVPPWCVRELHTRLTEDC